MSRIPYCMKHGDIVGSMLAMENGVWYAACSYNKRSNHRMMASEAITPAYTLMAPIFSFIIQTMYSAMR